MQYFAPCFSPKASLYSSGVFTPSGASIGEYRTFMDLFNRLVVATLPFVPRPIVRYFAGKYIAGERLSDAARTVGELVRMKAMATIDVLGEDISKREEAVEAREACKNVLRMIAEQKLDANLSVKLTQFGLKLDR